MVVDFVLGVSKSSVITKLANSTICHPFAFLSSVLYQFWVAPVIVLVVGVQAVDVEALSLWAFDGSVSTKIE